MQSGALFHESGPANSWELVIIADTGRATRHAAPAPVGLAGTQSFEGWLLYPRDYDPARRYPMVVLVHGGPGSSYAPGWPNTFFNDAMLSSAGYFVLLPNPRGSFGQGEAFTQANVKDFGFGDLRDILAGVDEVVKTLPVDNNRIGITGWSYGGFMTMWDVTQTHRFRAAVSSPATMLVIPSEARNLALSISNQINQEAVRIV